VAARLMRPCNQPGCGRLTNDPSGYCEKHRFDKHKQYTKQRRDKVEQSFYRGRKWTEESKAFRAVHPICQICHDKSTKIAHHVPELPILLARGDDPYDWRFLQGVCYSCHEKTKR